MDYQLIKQRIQEIALLLGAIATIVAGVTGIWNLYLLAQSQLTRIENENRNNLSTYASYGKYLIIYREEIQSDISKLLNNDEWNELDDESCKTLIIDTTKSKTGIELFGSTSYDDFRKVHNFYESLGFSLRKKVINFDIVFDLFTYPSYWDLDNRKWYLSNDPKVWLKPYFSVLLNMRRCIGENYFGIGKPLNDFSDNIDQLGYNYLYARLKYKFKNDCDGAKKLASDICPLLKDRIQAFEKNETGNEIWKKIY